MRSTTSRTKPRSSATCTNRVRFAVTTMTGTDARSPAHRFAFLTRHISDVPDTAIRAGGQRSSRAQPEHRHAADVPQPQRRRHHPRHLLAATPCSSATTIPTATHGDCRSQRLFHMANDSGLFHTADDLADAKFNGWSYKRGRQGVRAAVRGEDAQPLRPSVLHLPRRDPSPAEQGHAAAADR